MSWQEHHGKGMLMDTAVNCIMHAQALALQRVYRRWSMNQWHAKLLTGMNGHHAHTGPGHMETPELRDVAPLA